MSFGPRQIQSSDFLNKKFVKGCFSNLNNPFFISHIQNKGRDISPFRKYNNIKKQKHLMYIEINLPFLLHSIE